MKNMFGTKSVSCALKNKNKNKKNVLSKYIYIFCIFDIDSDTEKSLKFVFMVWDQLGSVKL